MKKKKREKNFECGSPLLPMAFSSSSSEEELTALSSRPAKGVLWVDPSSSTNVTSKSSVSQNVGPRGGSQRGKKPAPRNVGKKQVDALGGGLSTPAAPSASANAAGPAPSERSTESRRKQQQQKKKGGAKSGPTVATKTVVDANPTSNTKKEKEYRSTRRGKKGQKKGGAAGIAQDIVVAPTSAASTTPPISSSLASSSGSSMTESVGAASLPAPKKTPLPIVDPVSRAPLFIPSASAGVTLVKAPAVKPVDHPVSAMPLPKKALAIVNPATRDVILISPPTMPADQQLHSVEKKSLAILNPDTLQPISPAGREVQAVGAQLELSK